MPNHDFFVGGQWKAQCDICSRTYKSGELRLTWDKFRACSDCWYPRNPQDFIRGVRDQQAPPWTRPENNQPVNPLAFIWPPVTPYTYPPAPFTYNGFVVSAESQLTSTQNIVIDATIRRAAPVSLEDYFYFFYKSPLNVRSTVTPGSAYSGSLVWINGFLILSLSTNGLYSGEVSFAAPSGVPVLANNETLWIRVNWAGTNGVNSVATFSYSLDGVNYTGLGQALNAPMTWNPTLGEPLWVGLSGNYGGQIKPFVGEMDSLVITQDAAIRVSMNLTDVDTAVYPYSWVSASGETWSIVSNGYIAPRTLL